MLFLPNAMWTVFRASFAANLNVLGAADSKSVMRAARQKYKEIVNGIPPFGKDDVLLVNVLSAAMVAAVVLSLPERANVREVEEYYRRSMNDNAVMGLVLKSTNNFSTGYQKRLARDAVKSQRASNPYTWRYTFTAGPALDSFDTVFDKCGICELFNALGIPELVPALCAYDYEMAKYTNTVFTREYTLASGGPVCDCHYQRKT